MDLWKWHPLIEGSRRTQRSQTPCMYNLQLGSSWSNEAPRLKLSTTWTTLYIIIAAPSEYCSPCAGGYRKICHATSSKSSYVRQTDRETTQLIISRLNRTLSTERVSAHIRKVCTPAFELRMRELLRGLGARCDMQVHMHKARLSTHR